MSQHETLSLSDTWLEKVFAAQDSALAGKLQNSEFLKNALRYVSESSVLIIRAMAKQDLGKEKKEVLMSFGGDCLCHALTATRIGLWGAVPQSLALTRAAVESGAQFVFIVREKKYDVAIRESEDGKFKEITYKRAFKGLGQVGKRIEGLWGKISDAATHSTPTRLNLGFTTIGEHTVPNFGFSADVQQSEVALFYSMYPPNMLIQGLKEACVQDAVQFENDEIMRLNETYLRLTQGFSSRIRMSPQELQLSEKSPSDSNAIGAN